MTVEKELRELKKLVASDGWTLLLEYDAAMRATFHTWMDNQVDQTLPADSYGYGAMAAKQGEIRGRKALFDYVTARIATLENPPP
jgi:hypothetical protein